MLHYAKQHPWSSCLSHGHISLRNVLDKCTASGFISLPAQLCLDVYVLLSHPALMEAHALYSTSCKLVNISICDQSYLAGLWKCDVT